MFARIPAVSSEQNFRIVVRIIVNEIKILIHIQVDREQYI